ncbi:alanine-zipper protein [Thalassospira australica]|uniref:alanine-zipper protein n=1 Tax=Thalassospira australica TaxID=1528106 RepID=UPI00384CCBC5
MFDVRRTLCGVTLAVLVLGVSACAGTDQMSSLESRVAVIEQQQSATSTKIDQLETTANQALVASQEAKQAAQDAAETSRRVEEMFKKSMQK